MEMLDSVRQGLEMAKTADASGKSDEVADLLAVSSVAAQIALVMAVNELTDVLRPEVVDAEILDPPQLGWIDKRALGAIEPWRRIHLHNEATGAQHSTEYCVPVWVDAP